MENPEYISTPRLTAFERLGLIASVACAVECAAMPFVVSVLPLAGVTMPEIEWLEPVTLVFVLIVGGGSIAHAYMRHHGDTRPLIGFFVGFATVTAAHLLAEEGSLLGIAFSVMGASVIGVSQLWSNRLRCRCCRLTTDEPGEE